MKTLLTATVLFLSLATLKASTHYKAEIVPKKMTIETKKERFFHLVVPAIKRVHIELTKQYYVIKSDMKMGTNRVKIEKLKKIYKAKTDADLLLALKPHPKSIVIAQAILESGWATSRFFVKAKNIFGMWSFNKNEPRIAASEKRDGTRTIWLRKFSTIEESVREYYKLMGSSGVFKKFRHIRYQTANVSKIIQTLDQYAEAKTYRKDLNRLIKYNKLTKYDN